MWQHVHKIEGGFFSGCVQIGRSSADCGGYTDAPRETGLREIIFVMCTHTYTTSVFKCVPI